MNFERTFDLLEKLNISPLKWQAGSYFTVRPKACPRLQGLGSISVILDQCRSSSILMGEKL